MFHNFLGQNLRESKISGKYWLILSYFDLKIEQKKEDLQMANKKNQVQTYVDEVTKEKLDALCAKTGESVASIVRRALIKLLESEL